MAIRRPAFSAQSVTHAIVQLSESCVTDKLSQYVERFDMDAARWCCVIVFVAFLAAIFPLGTAQRAVECRECVRECRENATEAAAVTCAAMLPNSSCDNTAVFTSDACTALTNCEETCRRRVGTRGVARLFC